MALVRRAGVRGLPVDFDGAALLRDLRRLAARVYQLANEGLDSFFVTQTKVCKFDRVVAAMARAREALCRIVQSPTFSSVLFNALACVSTEDIDRGASPLQSFKAGKSLRLPPELKGMERIDALIWELTALIIAGNGGSRVLQAQQQKTPELRGSLRLGPGLSLGALHRLHAADSLREAPGALFSHFGPGIPAHLQAYDWFKLHLNILATRDPGEK